MALTPSKAEIKAKKKAYHKTIAYQKKRNKVLEICAWILALIVLAAALVYYNFIAEDVEAEYVYSVGEQYHDFTSQKFFGEDDDTYTLQDDLDDGKIVILNFWYIGCSGCEEELPHFGELATDENYSDKVSVVVIHAGNDSYRNEALTVKKSGNYYIEDYITKDKKWTDFYESVTWTIDTEDTQYFLELGGSNGYPITAILDSDGVIQYMTEGSMSKESLYEEVDKILAM
ncbi:MAG: redoxin family protein [Clostridia bacterium]|nr:redoxin family protein [Clostridia bacterium]